MPEELLERPDLPEVLVEPEVEDSLVPPAPPEGLDTVLYEHDERAARADLRRQIAAMELELARLFGSAFPRKGIEFGVPGMGGPRLLSVDELEKVRDSLAVRLQDVKGRLHDHAYVEERNRELIEEMAEDPAEHKWIRVSNEDIGEPGCKHWHSRPKWGPLGLLLGWWRVKISSGCPLAKGLRPPDGNQASEAEAAPADSGCRRHPPAAERRPSTPTPAASAQRTDGPPPAPWGSFPLSEIVIFIAIVMVIAGFVVSPPRGFYLLATGLVLGSLAGLELGIREHFSGYRSHSLLLAGAIAVPVLAALIILEPIPRVAGLAVAVLVFGGTAWLFAQAFRRRSGGALYRFKGG